MHGVLLFERSLVGLVYNSHTITPVRGSKEVNFCPKAEGKLRGSLTLRATLQSLLESGV